MSILSDLVTLSVQSTEQIHDYFQIVFSDGSGLSVYNDHFFTGCTLESITGSSVSSVLESPEEVVIDFSGRGSLSVGLKDNDYVSGPEAMQLNRPGKPTVIWN